MNARLSAHGRPPSTPPKWLCFEKHDPAAPKDCFLHDGGGVQNFGRISCEKPVVQRSAIGLTVFPTAGPVYSLNGR